MEVHPPRNAVKNLGVGQNERTKKRMKQKIIRNAYFQMLPQKGKKKKKRKFC